VSEWENRHSVARGDWASSVGRQLLCARLRASEERAAWLHTAPAAGHLLVRRAAWRHQFSGAGFVDVETQEELEASSRRPDERAVFLYTSARAPA
jgi:hypothetical protein